MASGMRGLTMFIADIRSSTSKEQERRRVIKELAHIRQKFTSKGLDGYNKKKYVWKLLYVYMLGYEVEFGHMVALKLITSPKYTEKNAGYTACAVLLNENHELLRLIIQSIKKDLANGSNEIAQCLALACIANVGGQEFAESLASDVQKILTHGGTKSFVKKKAALCLLRLFRKYPDLIPSENWPSKVLQLLDDANYGVLTSVMSLLLGLVSHSPVGYEEAPAKAIHLLSQIAFVKDRTSKYKYYSTICPWLQVKLLRLLQYFPPPKDPNVARRLKDVLNDILTKTKITNIINKNNADHGILFEAINVIIHLCTQGVTELQNQAITQLGRFISIREPNFRYLGLNTMTKLAKIPGSLKSIKRHQNTIQFSLKDPDVSIRKRALDLLYVMCDRSNSEEIVTVMLKHLQTEAYETREELVLKIAILAEKFAPNLQVSTDKQVPNLRWYVDVILQLIQIAGDFVTDDIWYRVVQIVTNNEDLQDYAATTCFNFLKSPGVHENGIKVGSYILGEFSHKISDTKLAGENGEELFAILTEKFKTATVPTKALILSAFVKLGNSYAELKPKVDRIFDAHRAYVDAEIQQRACEYYNLDKLGESKKEWEKTLSDSLAPMPAFPERKSNLLRKFNRGKGGADRNVWEDEEEKEAEGEGEEEEDDEEEEEEEEEEEKGGEGEESGEEEDEKASSKSAKDEKKGPQSVPKSNPIDLSILDTEEAPTTTGEKDEEGHSSDEDGGGSSGDEAEGGTTKPTSGGGLDFDPFGGFGGGGGGSGGSGGGGSKSGVVNLPEQKSSSLVPLYQTDAGTLYETDELKVEIKTPKAESVAEYKLALYFFNKTNVLMADSVVTLPEEEDLKIQCRLTINGVIAREANTPFPIEPGKQFVYLCLWHCKNPFTEVPKIKFHTQHGNRQLELTLAIPLLPSYFLKAPNTELDASKFIAFWKRFAEEIGPAVYKLPGVANKDAIIDVLTRVMKMSIVKEVDKEPGNIYAAAVYHTVTKQENGQFKTIPCFLRIETKPNMPLLRITAHAGTKAVSQGILNSLTLILNAQENKKT